MKLIGPIGSADSTDEEVIDLLLPLQELRAEVERLQAFVRKVADYSNDGWLAREAQAIAPQGLGDDGHEPAGYPLPDDR